MNIELKTTKWWRTKACHWCYSEKINEVCSYFTRMQERHVQAYYEWCL